MGSAAVIGIDGHDGSGKTTLAKALVNAVGGSYCRPFGGAAGRELLAAAESGDSLRAIEIGRNAVSLALEPFGDSSPVVLDRSWVTVASLMPWDVFDRHWPTRMPAIVCWCDLETTLERLSHRPESPKRTSWHAHYLARYRELADFGSCPLLRTDETDEAGVLAQALQYASEIGLARS